MNQASRSIDVLESQENVKIMSNVLKTNVSACNSIGPFYLPQLGRIWLDMLGLYKAVSGLISAQVEQQGMSISSLTCTCAEKSKLTVQDW
jgi:exportin-1